MASPALRQRRPFSRVAITCGVGVAALSIAYAAHGAAAHPAHGAALAHQTRPGPVATGEAPTGAVGTKGLQPALRHAFAAARRDAAAAGVALSITSGWRSHYEQAALFAAAVQKYGSAEAAGHWVLPPGESAHERGEAIDVGPPSGAAWLDVHGVHYGLCRRYANEPWHFELLAPAVGQPCPALEPSPHA
jgi:hypothetical protein